MSSFRSLCFGCPNKKLISMFEYKNHSYNVEIQEVENEEFQEGNEEVEIIVRMKESA